MIEDIRLVTGKSESEAEEALQKLANWSQRNTFTLQNAHGAYIQDIIKHGKPFFTIEAFV